MNTQTQTTNLDKKRSNILLTLGLASIPVFMYAATWLKDWN